MKDQRELPTIEIMGTAFIVDVEKGEFTEYGNERNSFSFYQMDYKGTHYEMAYNENLRSPMFSNKWRCTVQIPQLIHIDSEGMAKKYGVSEKDLIGKNDFDFRVDQQMYTERVFLGRLPVIDIAGDRFFVDMRFDELRWTKDISKRIILKDHIEDSGGKYFFYYDKTEKQPITIDPGIIRLPENVVNVVVPEEHILDPLVFSQLTSVFRPHVGVNEVKDYLMKHPFQKDLKAEIIPLVETELAEKIKNNKEKHRTNTREPLMKKSESREKGKRP